VVCVDVFGKRRPRIIAGERFNWPVLVSLPFWRSCAPRIIEQTTSVPPGLFLETLRGTVEGCARTVGSPGQEILEQPRPRR
jgi:hypothetical protein